MTKEEKEELIRLQEERLWGGDGLKIYPPGTHAPKVGPVPAPEWPWENDGETTITDQFSEKQ